jgi:hypothetical protein
MGPPSSPRYAILGTIYALLMHTTHASPVPHDPDHPTTHRDNSSLPVHISTGVFSSEIKMNFHDSSIPLIYEMPLPNMRTLQHYSVIPPNAKLPSIVVLNEILEQTHGMLDRLLPMQEPRSTRTRRSIEVIADFYSWCCGQAKQSDVDQLFVHEKSLDSFATAVKSQLHRDHSFLVSQHKIDNDFQNKVEKALNFSVASFSNVSNLLVRAGQGMESQINSEAMGLVQVAVTMHAISSSSAWLKTISDCRNGLIPTSVVNPQLLIRDLRLLNSSLVSKSQNLAVPAESISIYLTQPIASCLISSTKIIVTIKVPTVQRDTVYSIMRIHPLPFAFEDNVCQVKLDTNFVIIINETSAIPLGQSELSQCDPAHSSLCRVSRYSKHTFHSALCISSALSTYPMFSSIQKYCSLTCSHTRYPTTIIQQVDANTFLLVHPNLPITVECHGKKSQNITYRKEIGHLRLILPCRCRATIPSSHSEDEIIITPDFPCSTQAPFLMNFHHHILPAFVAMNDHIITDGAISKELNVIINPHWPRFIAHTNISAPGFIKLPVVHPLTTVGTHLSLASACIIIIISIILIYISYRVCGMPMSMITGANAFNNTDAQLIKLTMDGIMLFLFILTFVVVLLILYVLRNAAILHMRRDRVVLSSVKVRAQPKQKKGQTIDSRAPDEIVTRL